ncbi:MAG TPA: DUF4286 family protein [Gammaproteobacteria bacterium]|nr:DUF4286 family protein [Gammaproteobacteria bacterium]
MSALVYEVTLDIQADAAAEFDAWLKDHVRHMLALPGFHDARILKPEGPAAGTERRVVQYTLGSRAELDQYLAEHAPRMREDGVRRFGDKMKTSRRVFDLDAPVAGTLALPGLVLPPEGPRCRNCGTPLTGKFCMECGQKNHTYVAPLWNVLQDFAATHFGFDTKFFHSIVPLMFRPGYLTTEYCLGHEERYVKPFRLYLFTSIVFFFLAAIFWPQLTALSGGNNVMVNGKPVAVTEGSVPKQTKEETRDQIQSALQQLNSEPGDAGAKSFARSILEEELAALDKSPAAATTAAKAAASVPSKVRRYTYGPGAKSPAPSPVSGSLSMADGLVQIDPGDLKGKKDDADENRLTKALENLRDPAHQDEFKKKLGQNLPKMMFVLMPLIAIFLKLFYIGSKRYLTEHFVFTLHFHSMAFMVMLLVMLLGSLSHHVLWLEPLGHKLGTLAWWYIAIYLFLALRFFYRQGWFMTALKFFMLFISYSIAFGLTFAAGVVLTAVEL